MVGRTSLGARAVRRGLAARRSTRIIINAHERIKVGRGNGEIGMEGVGRGYEVVCIYMHSIAVAVSMVGIADGRYRFYVCIPIGNLVSSCWAGEPGAS